MFSSLGLAVIVCFVTGTFIVVALALKGAGDWRSNRGIAQILYDAEHPENRR
jgi:hypothetical protein